MRPKPVAGCLHNQIDCCIVSYDVDDHFEQNFLFYLNQEAKPLFSKNFLVKQLYATFFEDFVCKSDVSRELICFS